MPYAYDAELFCDACGEKIMEDLNAQGVKDDGTTDTYPQATPDGESDTVEHCASREGCEDAIVVAGTKIGAWLENPLTDEGACWLADVLDEDTAGDPYRTELHWLWRAWYADDSRVAEHLYDHEWLEAIKEWLQDERLDAAEDEHLLKWLRENRRSDYDSFEELSDENFDELLQDAVEALDLARPIRYFRD